MSTTDGGTFIVTTSPTDAASGTIGPRFAVSAAKSASSPSHNGSRRPRTESPRGGTRARAPTTAVADVRLPKPPTLMRSPPAATKVLNSACHKLAHSWSGNSALAAAQCSIFKPYEGRHPRLANRRSPSEGRLRALSHA